VPLVATRSNAGAVGLGWGAAAAGFPLAYYQGVFDNPSNTRGRNHATAPDGGTVLVGLDYGTSPQRGYIVWTDSYGALLDAKHLYNASALTETSCCVYDDDGNLYVSGWTSTRCFIVKFDTDRNIVWQRYLSQSQGSVVPNDIQISPDGYVYICGKGNWPFTSGGGGQFIAKYSTAGTLQWYKIGGNTYEEFTAMSFNPSGDIYLTTYNGYGSFSGWQKWTSAGAVYYQKRMNQNQIYFYGCAYDSNSGSFFVAGNDSTSGASCAVMKIQDSTGAVAASGKLTTDYLMYGYNVKVGTDGYIYVSAKNTVNADPYAGSNWYLHWSKWNSNLALQLQRETNYNPSGAEYLNGVGNYKIQMDATDNVYLSAYGQWASKSTSDCHVFYKAPNDGSLTGNYTLWSNTINYRAGNASASTVAYNASSNTSITWAYSLSSGTDSLTLASLTPSDFYSVEMV